MFIIKKTKLFLSIAAVLVVAAIGLIATYGLHPGVDFTGGTIVEVSYPDQQPSQEAVENAVGEHVDGGVSVRPTGEAGYTIRTPFLDDNQRSELLDALAVGGVEVTQERVSSIGPTIGGELASKALWAIGIVVVLIILFVAFSFRNVTATAEEKEEEDGDNLPADGERRGVSSWYYGLAAIAALIFDILIPTGMFALLGEFTTAEVDVLFVTALLAILGFSVNDTIVVFDRIRENLKRNVEEKHEELFADTVGHSLSQTFTRSINTSLTTLVVLLMLYLIGGSTTQFFALTLLVGVIAGTYSSLFLASPLLVALARWKKNA